LVWLVYLVEFDEHGDKEQRGQDRDLDVHGPPIAHLPKRNNNKNQKKKEKEKEKKRKLGHDQATSPHKERQEIRHSDS